MSYGDNVYFNELRQFENAVTAYFQSRVFDGCLADYSEDEALNVFVQRRHLSCLFSSICDLIYPTLETPENRVLVEGIIRDEYDVRNHREAYISELEGLGFSREAIRSTKYTPETIRSGKMLIAYALECGGKDEVYAITSLRFFAELLAGYEFVFFFQKLFSNSDSRAEKDSVFLGPHIDWDLTGSATGKDGHADQYLEPISALLTSRAKLETAKSAVIAAATARAKFYKQYCGRVRMARSDIEKATQ